MRRFWVLSLFYLAVSMRAANATSTELTVSAAASLKNALTQIARDFKKSAPEVVLRFNFGASGALQKQIENGAPVDIFVSAADKNMDELAAQKLVEKTSIRVVARNRLVLIVPVSSTRLVIKSFRDLARADVKNVAIGAPASVPAGKYAQQVLTKIGIWSKVLPKAAQAKDVREALTQVELGNVDAGIVYASDAATSARVRVVAVAPEKLHSPIRYLAAVVAGSRNAVAARDFVRFLGGARARLAFRAQRFLVP